MKKKILIIDDDPSIIDYLKTLFEDNNYLVLSAENSRNALDIVVKELPDLITLDLDLPDEWGPRFYRKLSRNDKIKNIPVVVISGLSGNEHAIPKAVASITKPFDRDKLLSIVRKTLL